MVPIEAMVIQVITTKESNGRMKSNPSIMAITIAMILIKQWNLFFVIVTVIEKIAIVQKIMSIRDRRTTVGGVYARPGSVTPCSIGPRPRRDR